MQKILIYSLCIYLFINKKTHTFLKTELLKKIFFPK